MLKKTGWFLSVCLSAVALFAGDELIRVPEVRHAGIKIDGVLDEEIWRHATELPELRGHMVRFPSPVKAKFLLCADKDNFYVGFRSEEPNGVKFTENASRPFASDNIEVFIGSFEPKLWFRQAVIDVLGRKYEEGITGEQWQYAVRHDEKVWTAEIALKRKYFGEAKDNLYFFNVLQYYLSEHKQMTMCDIQYAGDLDKLAKMQLCAVENAADLKKMGGAPTLVASDKVTHGPWVTGVSATTAGIGWESAAPCDGWVEWRESGATEFKVAAADVKYGAQTRDQAIHGVLLTGLAPDTEYEYRVKGDKLRKFRTMSLKSADFRFVLTSDVHSHPEDLTTLLRRDDVQKGDFLVLAGDLVTMSLNRDITYDGFLDAVVANWTKPIVILRGNHELRGFGARVFLDMFACGREDWKGYGAFCHKGVLFIILDADGDKQRGVPREVRQAYIAEESRWLNQLVASDEFKNAEFRVLISHVPPIVGDTLPPASASRHETVWILDQIPKAALDSIDVAMGGHWHMFGKLAAGSDTLVINGWKTFPMTRTWKFPVLINDLLGAIIVDKTADGLTIVSTKTGGEIIDTTTIPRKK